MKDLNVRAKTIKLLEEDLGINRHDFGISSNCLDTMPKAQAKKNRPTGLTIIKNFMLQRTPSRK